MAKPSLLLVLSFALALAACGGGGGSGGVVPAGSGPTPTPPVASPTPGTGPAVPLSGSATYSGGWAPYGVASGLDFPVQHGWNGSGQGVAIVIDSDVDRSVVQTYLTKFNIAMPSITTIPINGASGISGSDSDEAYLDVETVASLAPGAHIYIYQTPGLDDQSIADAYSKINSDGLARVVNNSFGGCEYPNPPEDPFIASGAQAGIAYVASAGDSGNVCDGASQVGASWPASNPNVIGAGGTETNIGMGYAIDSDTVWNDTSCQGSPSQCAGGGGPSSVYKLPAYQSGVSGVASTRFRNTPDISMPAEDVIFNGGTWGLINGTSWSSPQYAALMAEIYQYCHVSSGIANPVNIPYYVAAHAPGALLDVVNGNDQYQSKTPFYTAATDYDDASGLGVPVGMAYANTACPGGNKASGLLALSAMTSAAVEEENAASSTLDVTPRAPGLRDAGRRSAIAQTPIQVILRSETDRSAVESALENAGFTIERRFTYRDIVRATGPSALVEHVFQTQLHDVVQPGAGVRYMPATQVALPAVLAAHVRTVSLTNVTRRVLNRGRLGF